MKKIIFLCVFLSACAVTKELVPTGGSKSDAIVKMSYEYGTFEQPKIDLELGRKKALLRCAAWGFNDAFWFEGQSKRCIQSGQYGCTRWFVTIQYQCVNKD